MIPVIFFIIMTILVVYDFKYHLIPNKIVIPSIILGCVLTRQTYWAVVMFCFGAYLFNVKWCGGDVKLITMIGAFMGILSLFVIPVYFVVLRIYRRHIVRGQRTAAAPVFLIAIAVIQATSCGLAYAGYIPAIR